MTGVEWDQPFPTDLRTRWECFTLVLPDLNKLKISRWIGILGSMELHEFSDISDQAYGLRRLTYWSQKKLRLSSRSLIPRLSVLIGTLCRSSFGTLSGTATGFGIYHPNIYA